VDLTVGEKSTANRSVSVLHFFVRCWILLDVSINANCKLFITLNRLSQIVVLFLLLAFAGSKLFADEKIITGKFVISLTAEGNQKIWVVNALEQNIYNDLSGYEKVVPVKKDLTREKKCKKRNVDCIVKIYRKQNVDALMLGTVDESEVDYEIYDVQNQFLVKTGSIKIGRGSSLLKIRMGAFSAFKPFLEKGGILDKRKYGSAADIGSNESAVVRSHARSNVSVQKSLLVVLGVFTVIPYLLSLFGKPRKHPERLKIMFRWIYPFLIISLAIIVHQFMLLDRGADNLLNNLFANLEGYQWLLTGLGGMLWGYFLIINFKIVIPHLQGIERIRPQNLVLLLKASFVTILIKTLLIVIVYTEVFSVAYYAGQLFSVNNEVILLLLLPLSGLYFNYWMALLLDVFTMSIDVRLCNGRPDLDSVWNVKTRDYFMGHLKRNGVTLNNRLVKNTMFLAGDNIGTVCYGGGFVRPRITTDRHLIKFAMGDVDDFNPQDTAIFTKKIIEPIRRQNSVFRFLPTWSKEDVPDSFFKSRQDKKRVKYIESAQQHFLRDLKSSIGKRRRKTENVMQGVIYPHLDGTNNDPALMSDNADDMRIVAALLLKNSLKADPYDEDAEIDDSSEQDKDFLFGTLLHKFGVLIRHEQIFSTIYLYFFYKSGEKVRPYNFLFSRYFAIVADTFVVLNFGLNHLIQHLFYQATEDESFLTTKGITSGMLKSQDQILTRTKQLIDERQDETIQTDELDRIVWLSQFCQDPIRQQLQSNILAERVVKWSVSLGVVYFLVMVVMNSYNYHATYLEIIAKEKQKIAEAIKAEQERERKEL